MKRIATVAAICCHMAPLSRCWSTAAAQKADNGRERQQLSELRREIGTEHQVQDLVGQVRSLPAGNAVCHVTYSDVIGMSAES